MGQNSNEKRQCVLCYPENLPRASGAALRNMPSAPGIADRLVGHIACFGGL